MKRLFISLALFSFSAFSLNLPLRVFEDQGTARTDFPVTMGVPLPKGVFSKARMDTFSLFSAQGTPLAAEFLPMNLWEDTGSVRWLQVNTQLTLAPGETTFVYLTDRKGFNPVSSLNKLSAVKSGNTVTVITGPLKFKVRGDNFNGVDSAWVDASGAGNFDAAHLVVAGSDGFAITQNAAVSRTSTGGTGTVNIEESNRERVVLLIKGRYASNVSHFTRIYAYYNKSYVRIMHTFYVDAGTISVYFNLNRLALDIKAAFAGPYQAVIPGQNATRVITLADSASIHEVDCDKYRLYSGAQIVDSGLGMTNGLPVKPYIRTGWADLNNGTLGVSGGVRYFWEMYPKAVEVKAGGVLSICMYKKGVPDAERIHPGMGRTHELFLNFHEGADTAATLEANALVRSPLFLVAPNKWYCGQTQCVHGGLIDSARGNFASAYRTKTGDYINYLNAFVLPHLKARRGVSQNRATWNVYSGFGFVNFGDEFDEAPIDGCTTNNFTFEYDNNYYDFPYVVLMSFFVTGSVYPLWLALQNGTHMVDIDHVYWDPDPNLIGASRQCFSPGHIRTYDSPCGVYVSYTYNHYKCESAFELYYLTGDRFFLDRGLSLAGTVVARGMSGFDAGRSYMSSMNALVAAYRATHDTLYTNKIWSLWSTTMHSAITSVGHLSPDGQLWMKAMALEGLAKVAQIESSPTRLTMYKADLLTATNHVFVTNGGSQEGIWAGAWAYEQAGTLTQNMSRLVANYPTVNLSGLNNIHKYAGGNRSLHHWFQYLKDPSYNPFAPVNYLAETYIRTEKGPEKSPGMALFTSPNPFSPGLTIGLSSLEKGPVSLRIFDVSGRLVADLSDRLKGGAVRWNAGHLSPGLYVVRAVCNGKTAEKRVMLLK